MLQREDVENLLFFLRKLQRPEFNVNFVKMHFDPLMFFFLQTNALISRKNVLLLTET